MTQIDTDKEKPRLLNFGGPCLGGVRSVSDLRLSASSAVN
jgi:hypothetical protein